MPKEKRVAHCHKKIRDVAKAIASETYDLVMARNEVYAEWQRQNPECSKAELERRFVERNWGKFVPAARTTLGLLLRTAIDDKAKEEIIEVLALDQTLIRGRDNPPIQLR